MKKNISILIDEEIESPNGYVSYNLKELESLGTEYENIYIGDLIDYLKTDDIQPTLQKIIDKIKLDGKLIIKGPDILQMCWYCSRYNLDLPKFRYIVYNTGRKSCYSTEEIMIILGSIKNIEIISASYSNIYEYSIIIKKNEAKN